MIELIDPLPLFSVAEQELQKQLVRAEERIQHAEEINKKSAQFFLSMHHDIKTPISNIIGLSDILSKSQGIPKKIQEHIDLINISGKRLMDLMADMLHFADIESGQPPHRMQEFNLKDLIQKVIDLQAITIQTKGLQVLVDCDVSIAERLIGDSYRLHRVLLNLFANALKFTHAGTVRFIAKLVKSLPGSRSEIELSVVDTGIGIPEDKHLAIFERFARVSNLDGSQYEGSGLGLWMVKQFIEEMDGSISVESKVGEGTRFTCVFRCSFMTTCCAD